MVDLRIIAVTQLIRVWYHECCRVFEDRLPRSDQTLLQQILVPLVRSLDESVVATLTFPSDPVCGMCFYFMHKSAFAHRFVACQFILLVPRCYRTPISLLARLTLRSNARSHYVDTKRL